MHENLNWESFSEQYHLKMINTFKMFLCYRDCKKLIAIL